MSVRACVCVRERERKNKQRNKMNHLKEGFKSISSMKSESNPLKISLISFSEYISLNAFNFTIKGGKSPAITLPF